MKPLREVAQAYMSLSDAGMQLQAGSYRDAAENCRKAMEMSRTISLEEAFDHEGFDAFCFATLSEAFWRLGRFEESLQSAEKALRYFNRRGELNQDEGKLWIAAVFSKAVALQETGSPEDAAGFFRTAGEMIAERKGELPGKEMLLQEIEERLALLEGSLNSKRKSGYKAWWEFWS
ncbi:MAG: tetratricopeptide repeat protein [Chlorobium phaeobacteroides]|jgi:tetratricopeptide (TPR) repeat protein|nr:tetratricopeptide repeat protein [Chlorobium phaeobacteroides]